jgi:hypothetical protein
MSKVVRITDKAFARLQKLAVPFVDSPASVIDRLLDYYENGGKTNVAMTISEPQNLFRKTGWPGIFLAPADASNIQASITQTVSLNTAKAHLRADQFEALARDLGGRGSFNCWAMTESKRNAFEKMEKGDQVLIKESRSGKFNFCGRVIAKFESDTFGSEVWSVTPNKPWSLVYILDQIRPISIDRVKLVTAFGYESTNYVQGILPVGSKYLANAQSVYTSFDDLLDRLQN